MRSKHVTIWKLFSSNENVFTQIFYYSDSQPMVRYVVSGYAAS